MSIPKDTRKIAYSYIRFSTRDQIKGDSLRRQVERSEKYALENNLKIDSSLRLQDLGVSAFKGKNATEGALKAFLDAVELKKVPTGSTLIVESLDRLSRDTVLVAFNQFNRILEGGITIVTLIDNQVYSHEIVVKNPMLLFGSLSVMMRAHDEIATRADRVSHAWSKKRADAAKDKKPLTSRCPAWLELLDGKYRVIEERAKLVRRIFDLYVKGHGKRSIAKILNEEEIDTWRSSKIKTKSNGWHDSYIQKIVNNEAVLGRYQPHCKTITSKRRTPTGESIEDYFPAIIQPEIWQAARGRSTPPRGVKGGAKKVSNLFSGIVFDGYNGAVMRYIDKGGKRGHGKYLASDIQRLKPKSKGQTWPYPDFENLILAWLEGINWESLISYSVESEVSQLQSEKAVLCIKNEKLEKDLGALLDSFTDVADSLRQRIDEKIRKINAEVDSNRSKIDKITSHIAEKTETSEAIQQGVEHFKKLIEEGSFESRVQLQTEIRRRIKEIKLFRYGGLPHYGIGELAERLSKKPAIQIIYANGMEERIGLENSKTLRDSMVKRLERYKALRKLRNRTNIPPKRFTPAEGFKELQRKKDARRKREIT
jgi:DNA invertase Pin-like site-specific DNA recombinase